MQEDEADRPQLAQQARGVRWWLRAARRRPWVGVLVAVELLAGWFVYDRWNVSVEVRLFAGALLLGPLGWWVKHNVQRWARELELADEAAAPTGRRRPLDLPPENQPAEIFTWRSRAGGVLALQAALFPTFAVSGAVIAWFIMVTTPPPHTWGERALRYVIIGLTVIVPAVCSVPTVGAIILSVRALRAGAGPRIAVDVLGIQPDRQHWVLRRRDNQRRVTVSVLADRSRIVDRSRIIAGDALYVDGPLDSPKRGEGITDGPVLIALVGQFGTIWAELI